MDLLRLKAWYWFLAGTNAVLAILFMSIILSNPFASTIVLWRMSAISLIVEAVLDVVVLIMTGKEEIIEYKNEYTLFKNYVPGCPAHNIRRRLI